MGFGAAKALVLLQLSLFFVGSFTAEVDGLNSALPPHAAAPPPHHHRYHHKHHYPPGEAPSHPHPPVEPPTHHYPPVKAPPHHPPAKAPPHHHHHHHHHQHPPAAAPPQHHGPYPAPPKHLPPVHPPKPSPPVYHAPPTHAPVYPPKPSPPVYHAPPKYAPVHPPAHPPTHPFPRNLAEVQVNSLKYAQTPPPPPPPPSHPFTIATVAVEGVVYIKSCKYPGVDTLWGASPVCGATVKLQCYINNKPEEAWAKTDKNGYFFIEAPEGANILNVHNDCKVFLGPSPWPETTKPSPLNGGVTGAVLNFKGVFLSSKSYVLYTVGPLAYEPTCY